MILVGGSTKSPCVRKAVAAYFGMMPDTSVNPDEAVALGAAIQGSMLDKGEHTVSMNYRTPLLLPSIVLAILAWLGFLLFLCKHGKIKKND